MMRIVSTITFILIVLMGVNHIYGSAGLICRTPVYYTIGEFDERFGISREEALRALRAAEAVWEDSLDRPDIFEYQDRASLRVNFVYDERQRAADAASAAKDDLNTRGEANEVLLELHRKLVSEYKAFEDTYERKRTDYERELANYNAEVEKYNQAGGAPPDVYRELESKRRALDVERREINSLADRLNDLSDQINSVGDKGNELISEFNRRVGQFNDTFVQEREFTQGDYRGRQINIYTWNDFNELVLVLAHEFGHALSINHVEDEQAVMYYLMGNQPVPAVLAEADKRAFLEACEAGAVNKLLAPARTMYNVIVNR